MKEHNDFLTDFLQDIVFAALFVCVCVRDLKTLFVGLDLASNFRRCARLQFWLISWVCVSFLGLKNEQSTSLL